VVVVVVVRGAEVEDGTHERAATNTTPPTEDNDLARQCTLYSIPGPSSLFVIDHYTMMMWKCGRTDVKLLDISWLWDGKSKSDYRTPNHTSLFCPCFHGPDFSATSFPSPAVSWRCSPRTTPPRATTVTQFRAESTALPVYLMHTNLAPSISDTSTRHISSSASVDVVYAISSSDGSWTRGRRNFKLGCTQAGSCTPHPSFPCNGTTIASFTTAERHARDGS
jgi:hypothetical protein